MEHGDTNGYINETNKKFTYDLDDVTNDDQLDSAQTEQDDIELDEVRDQLNDDLDLNKEVFADEAFHDVTLPDEP